MINIDDEINSENMQKNAIRYGDSIRSQAEDILTKNEEQNTQNNTMRLIRENADKENDDLKKIQEPIKTEQKTEPKKGIFRRIIDKARLSDIKKDLGRDIKKDLGVSKGIKITLKPSNKKSSIGSIQKYKPVKKRIAYTPKTVSTPSIGAPKTPKKQQYDKTPYDSGIYSTNHNTPKTKTKSNNIGYGSISASHLLFGDSKKAGSHKTPDNIINNLSSISTIPGLHYGVLKVKPQKQTIQTRSPVVCKPCKCTAKRKTNTRKRRTIRRIK